MDEYRAALAHLRRGEYAAGASTLKQVLGEASHLLPGHLLPDAHANLGAALSAQHFHTEAITSLKMAVQMKPISGETRYNLALSLAESGRAREAEQEYRACIRLSRSDQAIAASAYNNLGNMALASDGRRSEALALFRGAVAADPANAMAHNNLANLLRDGTDESSLRAAGREYALAVRLSPRYLEAYKNMGNLLKEREPWRPAAVRAYRVALGLLPGGGALSTARELLLNLGDVLQWLGRNAAANVSFACGVARGVWQHPQQRPSHFVGGLRAAAWWTPQAAGQRVLQKLLRPSALATLQEEGRALLERDSSGAVERRSGEQRPGATGTSGSAPEAGAPPRAFQPYFSPALEGGRWSDVTLALSGSRQPGAALAPRSYALYESLGEAATTMVMGSAYFSVLSPGARLKPHCGPTNIRLRVHVGLRVAPGAAMRVGNETRAWVSGEAFVFDDSFEHEVWNASPEPRLVFILDLWHPSLRTDEERLRVLDDTGRERYERATRQLRSGRGLPEAADMLSERRVRTIY